MNNTIYQDYSPGQCNIGPSEIKRRLRMGYIGIGLMILFVIAVALLKLSSGYKLFLFIPTVFALSGILQSRQKFCFVFGLFGVFSFVGKQVKIQQDDELLKDRRKALWLLFQILLGSLFITIVYYYLG